MCAKEFWYHNQLNRAVQQNELRFSNTSFSISITKCRLYDLSKVFRFHCIFSTVRLITLRILCIMGNWICIIKQIFLSKYVRKCFLLCCQAVIWFAGHMRPDHCSVTPNVWQSQTTDSTKVNVPTPHVEPRVGREHSLLPQRSRFAVKSYVMQSKRWRTINVRVLVKNLSGRKGL